MTTSLEDMEGHQHLSGALAETPPISLPMNTSAGVSGMDMDPVAEDWLLDPVQSFTDFVNTMGLSSDWSMFASPEIESDRDPCSQTTDGVSIPTLVATGTEPQRRDSQLALAQGEEEPTAYIGMGPSQQWNVTQSQYALLLKDIEQFRAVVPEFVLPSRHALTRYISGYFDGFHNHLPFMHVHTFSLAECALEFILAIAAVGAQYRFESHVGLSLFDAAKAVSMEQARRRTRKYAAEVVSSRLTNPLQPRQSYNLSEKSKWSRLQTCRALLLLIVFATWDDDPELLREAIGFQTVLAGCLRESTLAEHTNNAGATSWHEWAKVEGDRRLKLVVFCYLTLQAIVYDIPPTILNDEINLRLPCAPVLWSASSPDEWARIKGLIEDRQPLFQDALSSLLKDPFESHTSQTCCASPLGNFVLIHALLQRLFMVQQVARAAPSPSIDSLRAQLECALHRWKLAWQQAPESSLDPQNPSGPIPFTSTAFLALAHVRLVCDLGPHRALSSRDPARIAAALAQLPPVDRSHGQCLVPALLHSAHALSIPVKLGVDFVARSQHFFWSVQQCVCSLECAVFLGRWLYQIGYSGDGYPLSESEHRLLLWIRCIVAEVPIPSNSGTELDPFELGLSVVRIWARIFKGNTSWRLVNILGESLEMLAGMMQSGSKWTALTDNTLGEPGQS
ncbi:uncharacterized protein DSM5745_09886 [Aspergillus mulundensis]|uniref:Xylanolytic transcriptional activator regulatory domain-containing protein n=1 Tax=Aspergillus mulundensis TaxID=1810919 RepID=A0A3D8QRQ1_9EURO|nr:Uncharacterized protein DSM5745_09886 [Aspergillus mulundensis]RDW64475.1 Uncharacterized protein DSM5745_09886 [Aspergillus mulundensis]